MSETRADLFRYGKGFKTSLSPQLKSSGACTSLCKSSETRADLFRCGKGFKTSFSPQWKSSEACASLFRYSEDL